MSYMGQSVETRHHNVNLQVLRGVASFELAKGLVVLAAAFGLLFLVGKDPWDIADGLLRLLHISPDHHFAQVFLDWSDSLTDSKLWAVAGVAGAYSVLRFVERAGLGRVDCADIGLAVSTLRNLQADPPPEPASHLDPGHQSGDRALHGLRAQNRPEPSWHHG